MNQYIKFIYFRVAPYMFWMVFPSIIGVQDSTYSNRQMPAAVCTVLNCMYRNM